MALLLLKSFEAEADFGNENNCRPCFCFLPFSGRWDRKKNWRGDIFLQCWTKWRERENVCVCERVLGHV